jgi:polysaccharide deacetylase 2 family uncharacterized protein YibQ
MNRNKKLVVCWCVFLAIILTFIMVTRISYHLHREHAPNHQYRILINKDLCAVDSQLEKSVADENCIDQHKSSSDNSIAEKSQYVAQDVKLSDDKCYERSNFGDIPKISSDGTRVLDVYSATSYDKSKKKICLAIIVDEHVDVHTLSAAIKMLNGAKASFIIPYYVDKLMDIVEFLLGNGHEFFIQLPTQSSIPEWKKGVVSPFLANTSTKDIIDKLLCLLSSSKYAIGIANTTQTLLTKSRNDMMTITKELAKRGMAFFDVEQPNEIMKSVIEATGVVSFNASVIFETKSSMRTIELCDGQIFAVHMAYLDVFLSLISPHKDYAIAPVSAVLQRAQQNSNDAKKLPSQN